MVADRSPRVLRAIEADDRVAPFHAPAMISDGPEMSPEEEGRAAGYARGLEEGRRDGARQASAMHRRMAETLEEVEALARDRVRRHEDELVRLAVAIAARLLRRAVAADDPVVERAVREAVEIFPPGAPVTVRVHPDDADALWMIAPSLRKDSQVTVLPDTSIERGGARLEDGDLEADVRLESQLRAVARDLCVKPVGSNT